MAMGLVREWARDAIRTRLDLEECMLFSLDLNLEG